MNLFSKPLGDISQEIDGQIKANQEHLDRQNAAHALLRSFPKRESCALCRADLRTVTAAFTSRGLSYVECASCGHLMSQNQPSTDYPFQLPEYSFAKVYKNPSAADFLSRVARVYKPKLDWARGALLANGFTEQGLKGARWVELGSGAGFFLSALRDSGVKNLHGVDADRELVSQAQERLGKEAVSVGTGTLVDSIRKHPADIYVSFFVFEHISDLNSLMQEIRSLPKGTVLVFSVPTFGMSVLLEAASEGHFARNLDGALHTQLFTDASIRHALDLAGLRMISQWVFGQDAVDFLRFFHEELKAKTSPAFLERRLGEMRSTLDGMQAAFDQNFLGDARHIVAIRS